MTTHPERDEELIELVRQIHFLLTGRYVSVHTTAIQKAIAAHTAKEVEAARRGFADQLKLTLVDEKVTYKAWEVFDLIDAELADAERFDRGRST